MKTRQRLLRRRPVQWLLTLFSWLLAVTLSLAQGFIQQSGAKSPFGGTVGSYYGLGVNPTLVDLDGDGDVDLLVVTQTGELFYYRNTGTRTAPVYTPTTSPIQTPSGSSQAAFKFAFGDLDGDGDLDAVTANSAGQVFTYRNTGSRTAPAFMQLSGSDDPLAAFNLGVYAAVSLADFDGDGDLDLLSLGNALYYLRNTGGPSQPVYTRVTGAQNPFEGVIELYYSDVPDAGDIDGDGDLDLIVGGYDDISLYLNTGTRTNPVYSRLRGGTDPFNGFTKEIGLTPALGDVDGDGDLDVVVGNYAGNRNGIDPLTYLTNVLRLPQQPTPASLTVCPGGSVNTAIRAAGDGPFTYQWYRNTPTTTTPVVGQTSATLTLTNIKDADAGLYYARVASSTGTLFSTAFMITLKQPLVLTSQAQSATSICSGGSQTGSFEVNFTGTDASATVTLFRDNVQLLQTSGSETTNIVFGGIRLQAGNYQIVVTNACTSVTTTFAPITVNPLPSQYSVTGGGAYCAGSTGPIISLAGSQTSVSYQLLRGTTAVGNPVAGTGGATSFGFQTEVGTYTVQATSGAGCSQLMSSSVTVILNPVPVVIVTSPPAVCAPATVDLTRLVSSDIPATIRFFTDAGRTQAVATPSAISTSGIYYVQATSEAGCVTNSSSIIVVVNTPPTVSIVPSALTGCAGTLITLSAQGADRYVWNTGATTTSIPVSATGTMVYSVTGTATATGCSATASQSVIIYPLPTAPSVLTQSGQRYPGGQSSVTVDVNSGSVNLVVSGCSGSLTWSGPGGSTGNNSPIVVSTDRVGQFVYTATCTSAQGCLSPLASATMIVQGRLTVLHRDVDNYADNNAVQPLIVLQNQGAGPLPLSGLTLRYYLTVEGAVALSNLSINYAQVGGQNVRLRYVPLSPVQNGAGGYVEYSFTAGAGSLAAGAGSGPIQAYFANSDYSGLNELDDYSYARVRDQLTATQRITAYYNGVLIAGVEPGAATQIRALRALTESRNGPSATQINTVLEVRNEGTVAINFSDLRARYYFTSDGSERLQVEVDEGNVSAQLVALSQPVTGANYYLEIRYNQGSQLAPGTSTGGIRYRISKPDGGRFDQTNDYSYQEQPQERSQNSRVVVLVGQEVVWGTPPTGSNARLATNQEPGTELQVRVLGNPVRSDNVSVQIKGAGGEPLQLQLVSAQGRIITQQQIAVPQAVEQHDLSLVGQGPGVFLLQVSTPTQTRMVRILKAE